jgi:hypothetical protein
MKLCHLALALLSVLAVACFAMFACCIAAPFIRPPAPGNAYFFILSAFPATFCVLCVWGIADITAN